MNKKAFFIFLILLILGSVLWELLITNPPKSTKQPCIQKKEIMHNGRTAQLWVVEGDTYLAKQTPSGQYEIVGLYSRFKN